MNWVDIELVLDLMFTHEEIPEVENPIPANLDKATIEFRNVHFTYDKNMPFEDQR
jgi:hypothetical protein